VTDSRAALIVASDSYQDPGLRRLRAPAADVEALARVLGAPEIGGFTVQSVLNEPRHVVEEAIDALFADSQRGDMCLLYFSCHGVKDPAGRLYFATGNTKLSRLSSTAISASWVNEQMDRSRSSGVVLLLDCCYSGAFARGLMPRAGEEIDVLERLGGWGRVVITASTALEYAFEGEELSMASAAPSLFTGAVVHGLESGEADNDGDGKVSVDELYDYVYQRVRATTPNQTPTKSVHNLRGDLYLARSTQPQRGMLPTELVQAIDSEVTWHRVGAVSELGRLAHSQQAEVAAQARAALQRLIDDDSRSVSEAAIRALSVERGVHWTRGQVALLEAELLYPGARALLDLAAQRAPRSVSLSEVAERTGTRPTQISAELGALTKLCKRLFGRDAWPMRVRSSPKGALYHMDSEVAEWWREATARASSPGPPAERATMTQDPGTTGPATMVVSLRNRFFREVIDRIVQQWPGFRHPKLTNKNYIKLGSGPFGHYAVSFIRDGRIRAGVLLQMETAEHTKRLFDLLYNERAQLEGKLDEQLDWERKDRQVRSWFGLHRPAPDLTNEQESKSTAIWAADIIIKLFTRLDSDLRLQAVFVRESAAGRGGKMMKATALAIMPHTDLPDRETQGLKAAGLVAADHQQRAVPLKFISVKDAESYRDQLLPLLAQLAKVVDTGIGHVRPWVWTLASGGHALTDAGNDTGVEVRLSYHQKAIH
jgi:hypothetical protein